MQVNPLPESNETEWGLLLKCVKSFKKPGNNEQGNKAETITAEYRKKVKEILKCIL